MKNETGEEISKVMEIIKQEINEIVRILKKHLSFLCFLIFFLESVLVISFKVSTITSIIILSSSFFILALISFLTEKINKAKKYKFKPKKRFTKKNELGDISIEESRIHQAIIYLSILEDEIW